MDGPGARYTVCHQGRTVEAHRIEHGDKVIIRDLSRQRVTRVTLGCAPSPGLEPNGVGEGVQPLLDPDESGVLRQEGDRDNDTMQNHKAEGSVASDVVGEIGPVSGTGVLGLRGIGDHFRQSALGVVLPPSSLG
jgi:hypothetical protein